VIGRLAMTAVAMTAAVAAVALPAHAADLGVGVNGYYDVLEMEPAEQALAVERMRDAGVAYVRIPASWSDIETAQSEPAVAPDPTWPGYDWRTLDQAVTTIRNAELQPLLVINHAPPWAEGPGRPPVDGTVGPGSWRPSAARLRRFARAVARRYSGTLRVAGGATLPRVRYFQAWNEPNLSVDLSPQYERRSGALRAVAPALYRDLLNGFYAGVKSVAADNVVLTAATAPYGDYPPAGPYARTPPVDFLRRLLCLTASGRPRGSRCKQPPHFDVLAFNAYPITPFERVARPLDTGVNDAGKVVRTVRIAERARTALPSKRHDVWLTEFGWGANERHGARPASPARQGAYLTQTLYLAWRRKIRTAVWWLFRDPADNGATFPGYSGLYARGPTVATDNPREALSNFSFPFLARRERNRTRLWGMAPTPDARVRIQTRRGEVWPTIATVRARGRVFTLTRRHLPRSGVLRAVSNGRTSPPWRVR
jgi:hypothetical protein